MRRVAVRKKKPPFGMPLSRGEVYQGYYYEAVGTSWLNNITKRNGKRVVCGHKHRTWSAANECAKKMRKERPGKCQTYRVRQVHITARKLPKPK